MVGPPVIDRGGNKPSYQVCLLVIAINCLVDSPCYRLITDVITTTPTVITKVVTLKYLVTIDIL